MAQKPNTDHGKFADWIIDRILRGMIGGLKLLPYRRRVALMGTLVRRVIGPVAGYRKRALANLAMIYPDMPKEERRRIADGVLDNVGRTLIENYSGKEFAAQLSGTTITGAGLEALKQAQDAGRPVLFVTGHFGNFEAPRQVLTAMGYSIGGLYRPMRNPYFNDHYARTMTDMSGPVFAQGRRGTAGFAKHLRGGGLGTLLFDVAVRNGVAIPFLGKPAYTATSAADIALRLDAVMIPYFGIRQDDGLSFDVVLEEPIESTNAVDMTSELTHRLERHVATHPEQWFWVHRRWKDFESR